MSHAIELNDISYSYDGRYPALKKVSLRVNDGEFIGIIGPNGGGKSTLLRIILGELEPSSGRLRVFGRTALQARQAIGYVPQFAKFPRNFPLSVLETVLMGRLSGNFKFGGFSKDDRKIALDSLKMLNMDAYRSRPIGDLSGGQLQRVIIARALATQPKLLLLDEPTASIDPHSEENIFDLLKEINKTVTVMVVSHDIGFISKYIDKVACINQTLVCHHTETLTPDLIESMYGGQVKMIDHNHTHNHGEES